MENKRTEEQGEMEIDGWDGDEVLYGTCSIYL